MSIKKNCQGMAREGGGAEREREDKRGRRDRRDKTAERERGRRGRGMHGMRETERKQGNTTVHALHGLQTVK